MQEFYSNHFIPQMPADTEIVPISRTIGSERLVDEMIIRFTHDIDIDWMLPGIAPTGKRVEIATVAVVTFRDGKLFNEHIYWDQASVLVQLGLLDSSKLPGGGSRDRKESTGSHTTVEPNNGSGGGYESNRDVTLNPSPPSNECFGKVHGAKGFV